MKLHWCDNCDVLYRIINKQKKEIAELNRKYSEVIGKIVKECDRSSRKTLELALSGNLNKEKS